MSTFIFNETASWVVNWVNKTFTVINQIEAVDEVNVGWADYDDFSFTWNTIVLADAPTIALWSPTVNYFKLDPVVPIVVGSAITLDDFLDDVYWEIGQSRLSEQFPESRAITHTQDIVRKMNNMKVNWSKKVSSFSFNKAPDKVVVDYSATEIEVDAFVNNYCPTSWMGLIYTSEPFLYSWLNTTTNKFTWISWLQVVYKGWDKVSIWYVLPAACKKVNEVLYNWIPLIFSDRREFSITKRGYYTIINWYLFLPYSTDREDIVTVQYTMNNSIPSLTTDEIDIETDYVNVVRDYVLYRMFLSREDDRYKEYKQEYFEWLRLYKSYISKVVNWIKNKIPSSIKLSIR